MKDDIVSAVNFRESRDGLFDLLGVFRLDPVSEHVIHGFLNDPEACLKDEQRDDDTYICFDIELEEDQDHSRDKYCS